MSAAPPPALEHFRVEPAREGLVHLVFDAPGRTMNVFSNAAILELGAFARWLGGSDVRGVVVCSGKASAFCAGADLEELGVAYQMIVAAPARDRFDVAFDHFFSLSRALRALERAGKPVAAAIGGLALGGGCELALACHHRVLADDARAAMGLPESLVGLLPGGGGTQRLPRLIGLEPAAPILLDGARLSGEAAVQAGLAHDLTAPGEEVAAAERWLLSDAATAVQPWDRPDHLPIPRAEIEGPVQAARDRVLSQTLGHNPAPLAILDCVEQGLAQSFEAAIRTEMSIFAALIQRPEPRNMIATLFQGKLDHDRAVRRGGLPDAVMAAAAALTQAIRSRLAAGALSPAGFGGGSNPSPVRLRAGEGYWIDEPDDPQAAKAREALQPILDEARRLAPTLTAEQRRMADYALTLDPGFPAYLGGPFALAAEDR